MTTGAADITQTQEDNGSGLFPTGTIRLARPAGAGFDAVRRVRQGSGAPRMRLSKRDGEIRSWKLLMAVVSRRAYGKCRLRGGPQCDVWRRE